VNDKELTELCGLPVEKKQIVFVGQTMFVREGRDTWRAIEPTGRLWRKRAGSAQVELRGEQ
jgi:hypothetical protein